MATNDWDYMARKPRYVPAESSACQVSVIRTGGEELGDCELIDLSRDGMRLKTSAPVDDCEHLRIRLHHRPSSYCLMLDAQVRWRAAPSDTAWVVGCLIETPIDFEALGELFLRGVLATDLTRHESA